MFFIGIDPGVSGGVAVIDEIGLVIYTAPMPSTPRDLIDLLSPYVDVGHKVRALVERVSSSPQMGVVSAFTFGKGFGRIETALAAVRIPYDEAAPAKWQSAMGCRSGGDKNITKRRAQSLFPATKITHAIADALILAEYARRLEQRRPVGPEAHVE